MTDHTPGSLVKFCAIPSGLYYSRDPLDIIKITLFRFSKYKSTEMWDHYRHLTCAQRLCEFADVGDMLIL